MPSIGPTELLVVLIIALLVFGPKRLPEMGKTIGKSLREFRRATSDIRDEIAGGLDEDDPPKPPKPPTWSAPEEPAMPQVGAAGTPVPGDVGDRAPDESLPGPAGQGEATAS